MGNEDTRSRRRFAAAHTFAVYCLNSCRKCSPPALSGKHKDADPCTPFIYLVIWQAAPNCLVRKGLCSKLKMPCCRGTWSLSSSHDRADRGGTLEANEQLQGKEVSVRMQSPRWRKNLDKGTHLRFRDTRKERLSSITAVQNQSLLEYNKLAVNEDV